MVGMIPFVVYNDLDENEENYIGLVKVALQPLLAGHLGYFFTRRIAVSFHSYAYTTRPFPCLCLFVGPDGKIQGYFELKSPQGSTVGKLTLAISWVTTERLQAVMALDTELSLLQLKPS